MRNWITLAMMAMLVILVTGCPSTEGRGVANPTTEFRFTPERRAFEFSNNKDVDVELGKATFTDASGRSASVEGLKVRDNSSDVRKANVAQIDADAARLAQLYIGIVNWSNSVWSGINELAATVAPYVPQTVMASAMGRFRQITTPWGGYTSGFNTLPATVPTPIDPAELAALKTEVAALKAQLAAATQPASEPKTDTNPGSP